MHIKNSYPTENWYYSGNNAKKKETVLSCFPLKHEFVSKIVLWP